MTTHDGQVGNANAPVAALPIANQTPFGKSQLGIRPLIDFAPRGQRWLWDRMIPQGALTMLAGPPGSSKTTLAFHLSARYTVGSLPGDSPPRSVLYLTTENDNRTKVRPAFEAAGADMHRVGVMTEKEITLPDDAPRLILEAVSADVGLIVIDPLNSFTRPSEAARMLNTLARLAAPHDITVLAVTHTVKSSKKPTADSMLGTIGVSGTARQVLLLGSTDTEFVVGVVKSNVGPTGTGWLFDVTYKPFVVAENGRVMDAPVVDLIRPATEHEVKEMFHDRGTTGSDARTAALASYLCEVGETDTNEVQRHLQAEFGVQDRTARTVIGRAVSAGLVDRRVEGQAATRRVMLSVTLDGMALIGAGVDDHRPDEDTLERLL